MASQALHWLMWASCPLLPLGSRLAWLTSPPPWICLLDIFSTLLLGSFRPKCLMAAASSLSCLCSEKPSGPCLSFTLFYSLWQLCLPDISVHWSLPTRRELRGRAGGSALFIVVHLVPGKWVACSRSHQASREVGRHCLPWSGHSW